MIVDIVKKEKLRCLGITIHTIIKQHQIKDFEKGD